MQQWQSLEQEPWHTSARRFDRRLCYPSLDPHLQNPRSRPQYPGLGPVFPKGSTANGLLHLVVALGDNG